MAKGRPLHLLHHQNTALAPAAPLLGGCPSSVAKTALGCRSSPLFRVFVFVASPIEYPAGIVWILQIYAPVPKKANFFDFFDFFDFFSKKQPVLQDIFIKYRK